MNIINNLQTTVKVVKLKSYGAIPEKDLSLWFIEMESCRSETLLFIIVLAK